MIELQWQCHMTLDYRCVQLQRRSGQQFLRAVLEPTQGERTAVDEIVKKFCYSTTKSQSPYSSDAHGKLLLVIMQLCSTLDSYTTFDSYPVLNKLFTKILSNDEPYFQSIVLCKTDTIAIQDYTRDDEERTLSSLLLLHNFHDRTICVSVSQETTGTCLCQHF